MNAEPSDLRLEQLLEKARHGDTNAWNALVAQMVPWLLNTAARMAQDEHLREDAVEKTLVEAWEKLSSFRYMGESSWRGWLKSILRFKILELLRKQRRFPGTLPLHSDSDDGSVVTVEPADCRGLTPEQAALRKEVIERVRRCVNQLPDEQREAIMLYENFRDRHSIKEVAEQLKISAATFKSRLSRARDSLRECLAREGLGPENTPL